jgi:hypothetical protein
MNCTDQNMLGDTLMVLDMYSDDIYLCVIIEACFDTVNQLTIGKHACK